MQKQGNVILILSKMKRRGSHALLYWKYKTAEIGKLPEKRYIKSLKEKTENEDDMQRNMILCQLK